MGMCPRCADATEPDEGGGVTRWEAALAACADLTDGELLDVIEELTERARARGWEREPDVYDDAGDYIEPGDWGRIRGGDTWDPALFYNPSDKVEAT